jgi:uncharacterized protein
MSRPQQLDHASRARVFAHLEAHLGNHPEIAFALVHGSFMSDAPFRDIDVGIWTTAAAGAGLDLQLSASLSSDLGVPVDVRRVNDAPTTFLFHVLRGRLIAVQDEACLAGLMERTARDYHDRAPLLRRAAREAFAR